MAVPGGGEEGREGGVINQSPTGSAEVREKLAGREVKEQVAQEKRETPIASVDSNLMRTGDLLSLYAAVQRLADDGLDMLIVYLLILAFGQEHLEELDPCESPFNRIGRGPRRHDRQWMTPNETFLAGLKRDRLAQVTIESGASLRFGKLTEMSKKKLVEGSARHFVRRADPEVDLNEHDAKGRAWAPGLITFPAEAASCADGRE